MGFGSGFRPGRQQTSSNLSGSAGMEITGSVEFKDELTVNGVLEVQNTTDASDATGDTGAFRVEGGASIAKKLYVGTDLSVAGDITLDDGGSIKEAGGTTAITISATGEITKLGHANANPTTGHYLQWDGSKALFQAVTSGGGADTGLANTFTEGQIISKDVNGEFEALVLQNRDDDADTDGAVSIRFDLEATDGSTVDSGKIIVKQTTDMTSTGASQDSSMTFSTSLNGTLANKAVIDSDGNLLLVTDASSLTLGADSDAALTHDGTTGLTISAEPISIDSTGELHLNSTTGDIKLQDGGVDQIAFDLDGTSGEVIMKPAVDSDDLVFAQYDGTEVIRIEDNGDVDFAGGAGSTGATITAAGQLTTDGRIICDNTTDATTTLDGSIQTDGGLSVAKDVVVGDDIFLKSDASAIHWGTNSEVKLFHAHDSGLRVQMDATAKPAFSLFSEGHHGEGPFLNFDLDNSTGEADNDIIGSINWFARDDQNNQTRFCRIRAVSEDVGNGSGASEDGSIFFTTMVNGSETDLMSINEGMDSRVVVKSDLQVADDLILSSDSAAVSFGADGEITLTHTDDVGLTLSSSAGHPTLLLGKTGTADDTATPSTLSLGGSFNGPSGGGSSGANPKLRYWEQGSNFMGVCIEQNEVAWTNSNADYDWSWRTNATDLMTLDAGTGLLTVVNDLAVGDDLTLTSDASVLTFGAGGDVTFTHDNGTGMDITSAGNLDIDCTAGSVTLGASLADGQTLKLGKNGAVETIIAPHGTPGNELYSVTNTAGTAANAISLNATAGGITLNSDATTAQAAVTIDAAQTTASGLVVNTTAMTTGDAISVDVNALTTGNALFIDHDSAATANSTAEVGVHYDFDHGNNTVGDGHTATFTGFDIDMNDAANAHHVNANVDMVGMDIDIASTATPGSGTGTTANYGIRANISGGDQNIALECAAGAIHMLDEQMIAFGTQFDVAMKYDEATTDSLLIDGDTTIADDKKLSFGNAKDASFEYDEDGTDTLLYTGASLRVSDDVKLEFGTGGDASIEYDENGTDQLRVELPSNGMAMGSIKNVIAMDVTLDAAHDQNGSVIKQFGPKIPAKSIITKFMVAIKQLSNLSTYEVNIQHSATNGTSADSNINSGTEIIGAGSSFDQANSDSDSQKFNLELGNGDPTLKKVFMIKQDKIVRILADDVYFYVCNDGTSNGTTNPSTNAIISVYIEYYGMD